MNSRLRQFTPTLVSLNKREVRDHLYDDVARISAPKTFGMLSGMIPREEIDCIRSRFIRPTIVAFDIHTPEIEAAEKCGVIAVRGNVLHSKTLSARELDFFNLDFCKGLPKNRRAIQNVAANVQQTMSVFVSYRCDGLDREANSRALEFRNAIERETTTFGERAKSGHHAGRASHKVGDNHKKRASQRPEDHQLRRASQRTRDNHKTGASHYARADETTTNSERAGSDETTSERERASGDETTSERERAISKEPTTSGERAIECETTKVGERAIAAETTIRCEQLSNCQLGRALIMFDCVREVRPEAQIVRVYSYRGNHMMMLGVLFSFANKRIQMLPPMCTVRETDTVEREYRLRRLGVTGKKLRSRLKAGMYEQRRAKHQETTKVVERAILQETTTPRERAKTKETTMVTERATRSETTTSWELTNESIESEEEKNQSRADRFAKRKGKSVSNTEADGEQFL